MIDHAFLVAYAATVTLLLFACVLQLLLNTCGACVGVVSGACYFVRGFCDRIRRGPVHEPLVTPR